MLAIAEPYICLYLMLSHFLGYPRLRVHINKGSILLGYRKEDTVYVRDLSFQCAREGVILHGRLQKSLMQRGIGNYDIY